MSAQEDPATLWATGSFDGRRADVPRVLFGQVHEDAGVECFALSQVAQPEHVFAIGSGGCTAFALLAQRPARATILDINPAQLWLIELKRAAFLCLEHAAMLGCLAEDATPHYAKLCSALSKEARHYWDAHPRTLHRGLNQSGLAERNLRGAMVAFRWLVHGEATIRRLLAHRALKAQTAEFRSIWDTGIWRAIFRLALNRPALRLVYAPAFLAKLPRDFALHMKTQVDEVFHLFPTATNPYLWQTFLATYPLEDDGLPVYLRRINFEPIRDGLARTELIHSDALDWLQRQPDRSIDFFALSNILEVTRVEYAPCLFTEIARVARAGALVCLRAIFPASAVPAGERWHFESELTAQASALDRSLGCRNVRLFRIAGR